MGISSKRLVLLAVVAVAATACAGQAAEQGPGETMGTEPSPGTGSSPPVQLTGPVNDRGTMDLPGAGLTVEAGDFYFAPTFIKAAPGTTVFLEVENEGDAQHTFTIDSLGVDQVLQPGDRREVSFTLPASGAVNFYCRFHVAQGMQGALFSRPGETVATDPGAPPGY